MAAGQAPETAPGSQSMASSASSRADQEALVSPEEAAAAAWQATYTPTAADSWPMPSSTAAVRAKVDWATTE